MSFRHCPACTHRYVVREDLPGHSSRCARCGVVLLRPAGEASIGIARQAPERAPRPSRQNGAGLSRADLQDTQPTLAAPDAEPLQHAPLPAEGNGPLSTRGYRVGPLHSITLGDFRIRRKLGGGSMGAVYLAHQHDQQRPVALKVLYKHLALQPAFVERFYQEARAMARLSHPGIVRIYGVCQARDFHCIAMEFVEGFGSGQLMRRLGGRYCLGDALFIAQRTAEALLHAHGKGVIHRDVKPGNLLLSQLGHVKLTDLGLAKPLDEDMSLTDTGMGLGTPQYMAPEQFADAKAVDHRADIYALGSCLYEFVTGRPPFAGANARRLLHAKERGRFDPARSLNPEVPRELDRIIETMLARDVPLRYPGCAELLRDLESLGMTHQHLSFNVLRAGGILRPDPGPPSEEDFVEVLLIHDDSAPVELVQDALELSGRPSNVTVVSSGVELIDYLERQESVNDTLPQPGLILMDFEQARKDEGRILRLLRESLTLGGVPVILLTGSRETAEEVLEAAALHTSANVCSLQDAEQFRKVLQASRG